MLLLGFWGMPKAPWSTMMICSFGRHYEVLTIGPALLFHRGEREREDVFFSTMVSSCVCVLVQHNGKAGRMQLVNLSSFLRNFHKMKKPTSLGWRIGAPPSLHPYGRQCCWAT